MVAQDQVDPVGILALQRRDQVDELVRPVAAVVGVHACPWISSCRTRCRPGSGRGRRPRSDLRKAGMLPCRSPTTITSSAASERDDPARAARGRRGTARWRVRMVARIFCGVGHGTCRWTSVRDRDRVDGFVRRSLIYTAAIMSTSTGRMRRPRHRADRSRSSNSTASSQCS